MGPRSLLLTTTFPPATGGIETLLYEVNRRLQPVPLVVASVPARAAAFPTIAVQTTPSSVAARAAYRVSWLLHPSLHYLRTFLPPALHALEHEAPQVIQCGHIYLAPLAWLLARRSDLPFIVYAYGQEVWRGGRRMGLKGLDDYLRGRALREASRVLVPGSFTAGLLKDWAVRPERVSPVPYGADPRPMTPFPEAPRLLSVGRLVPRKGVDVVLQSLGGLKEAFPRLVYRVVGSGPDEGRLRRIAETEGVSDRVHFLGRVSDEALAREYQEASLMVLPSRRTGEGELEGLGLVYLEAAAWGRPVLAGCSGGEVDAVVDGVTGRLVDGTSVSDVTESLRELLSSPDVLRSWGEAGRERVVRERNWAAAGRSLQTILDSTANGGTRRVG